MDSRVIHSNHHDHRDPHQNLSKIENTPAILSTIYQSGITSLLHRIQVRYSYGEISHFLVFRYLYSFRIPYPYEI
jgi:hypothetical protein